MFPHEGLIMLDWREMHKAGCAPCWDCSHWLLLSQLFCPPLPWVPTMHETLTITLSVPFLHDTYIHMQAPLTLLTLLAEAKFTFLLYNTDILFFSRFLFLFHTMFVSLCIPFIFFSIFFRKGVCCAWEYCSKAWAYLACVRAFPSLILVTADFHPPLSTIRHSPD